MRTPALLVLLLSLAPAFVGSGAQRYGRSTAGKSVNVRTYTRKDGTVVRGHDRAAPGVTPIAPKAAPARKSPRWGTVRRDSRGRIQRSESARESFQRAHPCPSTGRTSGGCKGYIIDHVKPLACDGADSPANMQWQTTAAAKAKDKWERVGCR